MYDTIEWVSNKLGNTKRGHAWQPTRQIYFFGRSLSGRQSHDWTNAYDLVEPLKNKNIILSHGCVF